MIPVLQFIRNLNILILLFPVLVSGQETVHFYASDGLQITADWYRSSSNDPFILLFHQAGFSRGEYRETAPRLQKLGYNCLAVDLRSGKGVNFVKNETALNARSGHYPDSYLDAIPDIRAAIDFARSKVNKPVILLGSSYSASLVIMESIHRDDVKAVVAFSPGEYFGDPVHVKNYVKDITTPLFVASTLRESEFIEDMISGAPKDLVTFFYEPSGKGEHGSKTLWSSKEGNQNYWLRLMLFFNSL